MSPVAASTTDPDAQAWLAGGPAPAPDQTGSVPQPVSDPGVLARFAAAPKPVSDQGVLARFKASTSGQTPAPTSLGEAVTDIPAEALAAGKVAIKSGASDIASAFHRDGAPPDQGFWSGYVAAIGDHITGAGRFAKGLAEIMGASAAAVVGGESAPAGYELAQLEHGIGTVIAPQTAAKDDPQAMYDRAKADTAQALQLGRPKGGEIGFAAARTAARAATPPPAAPTLPPEAVANQAAADEFNLKLSRGQATGNLDDIRYEDMAARDAYGGPAQEVAAPFFEQQFQGVQDAGRDIGERVARNGPVAATPADAASGVNADIGATAEQARAAQAAAEADATREAGASRGIVDDQGRVLTDALQEGHLPIENPREAGEIVGHGVRTQAATDRAAYQALYREARDLPGQFHAGAFEGIGNRIQGELTLGEDPVIIDDVTTPIASRAIRDLDNISNLRIQNRADPFGAPNPENITAVDLRGVDQARKRLVAHYRVARGSNNASDVRATERLIDGFDNQVERAITEGLFSGDPRALQAIQEARGAYSRYARAYRPQQAGDDVGGAMRRIIDRQATPEEIANMVIGSGRLGNAGLPVRLADRLEQVLGRGSDAWSSIRQGIWQRASQIRTTGGEIDPARSASNILEFANSSLGRRMFSQQELRAMRAHAQGVRDLDRLIEEAPATQAATRVRAAYHDAFGGDGIGGAQQTAFRRIVEGAATPEETAQAVFSAIGGGNPGNVTRLLTAIERIAGGSSDTMAAIRQGVWQKLTQNAAGKDQPGQQKLAQSIAEFLNGKGRTIAQQLYTPDELALMQRYADVVKRTVIPKYARTNSDTAPALLNAVNKYAGAISSTLGAVIEGASGGLFGGALGAATGFGVGKLIEKGVNAATEVGSARKVSKQFDWLNNPPPPPKGPVGSRIRGGIGAAAATSTTADELHRLGLINQPFRQLGPPASPPVHTDEGDRNRPVQLETPDDVHKGAERTEIPSPAQAEAGNYSKRHLQWKGLNLAIETEAGQDRTGMGRDGKPWSVTLAHPYGYIKATTGKDGDPVDVYVGPHPNSPRVFVFDQIDPESGKHDEHKLVIGARDVHEARAIYDSGFSDGKGPQRRGAVQEMSVPALKTWLAQGDTDKPIAYDEKAARARVKQAQADAAPRPSLAEMMADKRSAKEIKADLMRRGVLP